MALDLYGIGYYLTYWIILVPLVFFVIFVAIIAAIVGVLTKEKPKKKKSDAEILDEMLAALKTGKLEAKKTQEIFSRFKTKFADFSKHKMTEKACEFLHLIAMQEGMEIETITHFRDELAESNEDSADAIQKAVNTALKEREKHNKSKK